MQMDVTVAIVEVTGSLKLRSGEAFLPFAVSPMILVRYKLLGLRKVNFTAIA